MSAQSVAQARRWRSRSPTAVGVGHYRIDLHPSTGGDNYIDIPTLPFQIPLGALIPVRVRNLLPACKNIGTTHITNGCYRLHPVEWNIGESAGLLAAFCVLRGVEPHQVYETPALLEEYQNLLRDQGDTVGMALLAPSGTLPACPTLQSVCVSRTSVRLWRLKWSSAT
jgi:hypothetical protein